LGVVEMLEIDCVNFKLCVKYLPKLRAAGYKSTGDSRMPFSTFAIGIITNEGLQEVEKPCTLGLEELTVLSLPDGIELPNLTSLHLFRTSSKDFHCDDERLRNVSELALTQVSSDACMQILSHLGGQLKILRIDVMDTVEIDVILQLCPNLKHLNVEVGAKCLTLANQVELGTVQQLNVLELAYKRPNGELPSLLTDADVDTEVLLQLLQAPELLQLVLVCRFPKEQQDVDEIVGELRQQKILQNLERVVLNQQGSICHGSVFYSRSVMEAMVLFCPKLIDVSNGLHAQRYMRIAKIWDSGNR
jgi:hypothetical protein